MNSRLNFRTSGSHRLAPLVAAVALCLSGTASAATIMVDSPAPVGANGKCAIVDAVSSINQGSIVSKSRCLNTGLAFGDNDTISFVKGLKITFTAPAGSATSALVLHKRVTMKGRFDSNGQPAVTIARSATARSDFRLIESSADLVLNHLTIAGGSVSGDGGGIKLTGNAALETSGSVISGNAAAGRGGGIFVEDSATSLKDSTVSGNTAALAGGGIYNYAGEVTLSNSTVSDNDGGELGGGLAVGALVSNSSTISGNSAVLGGGAYTTQPSHLANTTISDNAATVAGGGMYASGDATFLFSTISGNSVGPNGTGAGLVLFFDGSSATATIISGNASGHDIDGPYGATLAGNHNLIGTFGVSVRVPFDSLRCDPNLAPLMDDGGPTMTRPLMAQSCAVDAGPSITNVPFDQRGESRTVGLSTDIGAVEKQSANDPPVH